MNPITFLQILLRFAFASVSQKLFLSQDDLGSDITSKTENATAYISTKPFLSPDDHEFIIASTTENANQIFNAIYSSMRQWGSSIQHNGMSAFPAYIPEGTLLYHGGPVPEIPESFEWLAFEIPHAENFARRVKRRRPKTDDVDENENEGLVDLRSMPIEERLNLEEPDFEIEPGYLHIYQANRPLKVLYLDGMSAANSERGTLDFQDILILNFTQGIWAEWPRAAALCDFGKELGVEGFIRMECGFELIKCDFSNGLDFLAHRRRPDFNSSEGLNTMALFEFVRDIGSRYHGIDAGRVSLDYSSMVSAFFYPTDLSNLDPDPRQSKLPRLVNTDDNVLKQVRSHVRGAVADSNSPGIDWQGVTDMIVKRFAPRLSILATGLPHQQFLSEVNLIMNTFIDYEMPLEEQDPAELCSMNYFHPVHPSTESDLLIGLAFKTVTHKICDTFWDIRTVLLQKKKDSNTTDLVDTSNEVHMIQELMDWLDWSDWTACGQCAVDEVCFIAFFPIGTEEDHYHPRCLNRDELETRRQGNNYWQTRQ